MPVATESPAREQGSPAPDISHRRWWTRGGVVFVGALAMNLAKASPAGAYYRVKCCTLAKPPHSCPVNGVGFRCPSGYYKRSWACCYYNRIWGCGECTKASTCWNGPWACSTYWYEGSTC